MLAIFGRRARNRVRVREARPARGRHNSKGAQSGEPLLLPHLPLQRRFIDDYGGASAPEARGNDPERREGEGVRLVVP